MQQFASSDQSDSFTNQNKAQDGHVLGVWIFDYGISSMKIAIALNIKQMFKGKEGFSPSLVIHQFLGMEGNGMVLFYVRIVLYMHYLSE